MKARKLTARLGAAALCLLLISLAGCFDYEVALDLNKDGSGSCTVGLKAPAFMAKEINVKELETLVYPLPARKQLFRMNRVLLTEKSSFSNLDDLAAWRLKFKVEQTGLGFMGLGGDKNTVTCWLQGPEGDLPNRDLHPGFRDEERVSLEREMLDPAAARARQLLDRSLGNDFLTISFTLPGTVAAAWPLNVGKVQVKPFLQKEGAKVVWKVPMSVLVTQNVRHTLIFRAQFSGNIDFRGETRKDAVSRYATISDVALAEQDLKNRMLEKEQQMKQQQKKQIKKWQLQDKK